MVIIISNSMCIQDQEVLDVVRVEEMRRTLIASLNDCAHQQKGVSVAIRLTMSSKT